MYLDSLNPLYTRVGYGTPGLHGDLGYEGKRVIVKGEPYQHAISTHPPARMRFRIAGEFRSFTCMVALTDDVPAGRSHADFSLLADGVEVGSASYVMAGESPRRIEANIAGASELELVVRTSAWECCHAVWLDPMLDGDSVQVPQTALADCLGRAEITIPARLPKGENCIATVVSPGFETLLDDMLGSLAANGNCPDALLVVFGLDANEACEKVAAKYGATLIPCRSLAKINPMSKGLMYSAARVVDAQRYICLDADMLVLGELRSLFAAIDVCPEGSIFACSEGNHNGFGSLGAALKMVYGGNERDLKQVFNASDGEEKYPLVVNDGIFAGSRTALLALDGIIRAMPGIPAWVDGRRDIWWRNQFVFNIALARMRCGVELDATYNVQLHAQDARIDAQAPGVGASFRGRPVRVLHFSGGGRQKYPEIRNIYARVPDPLVGNGEPDAYGGFLSALRSWLGEHGASALAWSFYGTTDGGNASVRDIGTFPLFGALHYLIRANGCVRVLETGTARGVSAACLASSVAHRSGGRVVTFDPYDHEKRAGLWARLPENVRSCIEARAVDSLAGMAEAIERGESYHAALLDSIHTAEHVLAEFHLAARLVCPGGIILIHDARYAGGTVEEALRQIEADGYGVVRLWTAEESICEDDHLGLAVIENRRQPERGDNQ